MLRPDRALKRPSIEFPQFSINHKTRMLVLATLLAFLSESDQALTYHGFLLLDLLLERDDPCSVCFQKFAQSLKGRPRSPATPSVGFEFVQKCRKCAKIQALECE
jgi:hypothetical protein